MYTDDASGRIRKIIHVDMDAFYASVEQRDNPALRGLPVVVGGSPAGRGVVAAASYEARRYGIRSAMPCARAYRLCPDAIFVPPNFEQYRTVSGQIHEVFLRYTELVEPLSLDEAYLDVTVNLVANPSATRIAQAVKREIRRETGLTASAGVAPNKFLAKIASEEKKPDGLFVIRPQDVAAFVERLPLRKVPGVGEATLRTFEAMGLATCGELAQVPLAELIQRFGKRGSWFHRLARGIDERPVEPHRERKSVSIEDTFAEDHAEPDWLLERLKELCAGLEQRLRDSGVRGRTVTLKLRTSDFQIHTRSRTLERFTDDAPTLYREAAALYRASGLTGRTLRLLGVGVHQLDTPEADPLAEQQLALPGVDEG